MGWPRRPAQWRWTGRRRSCRRPRRRGRASGLLRDVFPPPVRRRTLSVPSRGLSARYSALPDSASVGEPPAEGGGGRGGAQSRREGREVVVAGRQIGRGGGEIFLGRLQVPAVWRGAEVVGPGAAGQCRHLWWCG